MPIYRIVIQRGESEKEFIGTATIILQDKQPKKTRVCRKTSPWELFAFLSSWLHEETARYDQEKRIERKDQENA